MDLKYLLCEPVSRLAVKANEQTTLMHQFELEWPAPIIQSQKQDWNQPQRHDWNNQPSSPTTSMCSSISTCSSTSSNSKDFVPDRSNSFSTIVPHQQPQPEQQTNVMRRRAASDVSLIRHHMFVYSHPNRRPRSESAGNNNVQTRTPWTPFEDHLLQQGYDQGLSWAMISSTYLPHRSRGCCWGRFKTLQNKNMVDPSHSHMRHFRRPWKAIDFTNNNKKPGL
jgi:hypothetical protein